MAAQFLNRVSDIQDYRLFILFTIFYDFFFWIKNFSLFSISQCWQVCLYLTLESSAYKILSSALECTINNTLRPLAQKGCAPLSYGMVYYKFRYQALGMVMYIISSEQRKNLLYGIVSLDTRQ